jgi:hypothetical protein
MTRSVLSVGLSAGLCVVLLAASVAPGDTVVFKDDLELSGPKVEIEREHALGVDVRVSHGTITIRWPRIKRIAIDFDDHLASMQADGRDTASGLHRFFDVLVRHTMTEEAAQVAALILAKEHVAESILVAVMDQMEEQKEWKLAKQAGDRILSLNASRTDIQKRLDQIAKQMPEDAGNVAAAGPDAGPGKEPGAEPGGEPGKEPGAEPGKEPAKEPDGNGGEPKPPKPPVKRVRDGLEGETEWVAEQWGNPAEVQVVEQGTDVKNRVLSVAYREAKKDKVAVRLGGTWDLTAYDTLSFEVWNASGGSMGLTVAFNTLPGWRFFETPAKRIPPKKWTPMTVDLNAKRFKCAESKWRHNSKLENRDNVKQIILMIYSSTKEGVVYFDRIDLEKKRGR